MCDSVQFYRNVLGMELVYGGEESFFSSLRTNRAEYPILNLEQGPSVSGWGRMIFYVADVDAFWAYLKERGFGPPRPQDAFGVSGISICLIRMGMSCRLRARCGQRHEHGEPQKVTPED